MPGRVRIKVLVLDVEKELSEGTYMEIPGSLGLDEFIKAVRDKYPGFGEQICPEGNLAPYVKVFINGRVPAEGTEDTLIVEPGSEVVFYPAIHGG